MKRNIIIIKRVMARNGFYWHSRCSHSHRILTYLFISSIPCASVLWCGSLFIFFFNFSFHFEYSTRVIQRQFRTACSNRQTRLKCTLNAVAAFFIESTKYKPFRCEYYTFELIRYEKYKRLYHIENWVVFFLIMNNNRKKAPFALFSVDKFRQRRKLWNI